VSEEWTAIARRYWAEAGVAGGSSSALGDARATLAALLHVMGEASFDFAFIDADKPSYGRLLRGGLRLVRPGGRSRSTTP